MNIIFRTDASMKIGTGHIMRCLTLADRLRAKGAEIAFINRALPGNLSHFVKSNGYKVYQLPCADEKFDNAGISWETDAEQTASFLSKQKLLADWLIVDQYDLDKNWELKVRPYVKKIMVIDDLADRPHDCDLLLDQNFYINLNHRYEGLVPNHCQKLLGPRYLLLRPEFGEARKNLRERHGSVKRIFIFFGGSDASNQTLKALKAIRLLDRGDIGIDVVVGSSNRHQEQIKRLCGTMPGATFYCQVKNMAQLMLNADLAIGAGGTTTWERCYLGLPTITIITAPNQAEMTAAVAAAGATWNIGRQEKVKITDIANSIKKALNNPYFVKITGLNAMRLANTPWPEKECTVVRASVEGEGSVSYADHTCSTLF